MKGPMMISVRRAGRGDAELLAGLNAFVQELHSARMPDRFKPADPFAAAEWFRTMMEDPRARAWMAEVEGTPAGYVLSVCYDRAENPFCFRREYCEIDQISVVPEFRRRGVARALVGAVLAEARSNGIVEIVLNSWSFNAGAHEAFRALGFAPEIVRFRLTGVH